jgi:hypothetical protein
MKKTLLLLLFSAAFQYAQACSCFWVNTFCEGSYPDYSTIGVFKIIANPPNDTAMYVVLEETIFGNFESDTFKVIGQDGLNCNAGLGNFNVGETWVLNLFEMDTRKNVKGLSGCFPSALQLVGGMVTGAISPSVTAQSLADFKNNLGSCLAMSNTSAPQPQTVTVTPNPVASFVEISADEAIFKIDVLNMAGQLCYSNSTDYGNRTILATDELKAGLYIVRIYLKSGVSVKQILKQ